MSGLNDNTWDSEDAGLIAVNKGNETTGALDIELISGESIGFDDKIDYRELNITAPGLYSFSLNGLGEIPARFTLYSVVKDRNGNDSIKAMKSFSVIPVYNRKTGTWINTSGATKDFLLGSGTYYISVDAPKMSAGQNTDYSLGMTGVSFNGANMEDDDKWNSLAPSAISVAKGINPDANGTGTVSATLLENEWVGYGDSIDYRKINIEAPGSYNFTLNGLTAGSPAKFTLYSILTDKDGNETGLKALKTFTSSNTASGASGALLLDNGSYYISVEAVNATQAKNTAYSLSVSGTSFNEADMNDDDTWNQLGSGLEIVNIEGNEENAVASNIMGNEWVGYGDKIDYRRVNIEAPGSYNFTLDGLTLGSPAKFTLYSIVTDKDGNETGLKALKTFTVSKTESGSSGTFLLESGAYYVSVEAPNAAQLKNTSYSLDVTGTAFGSANKADDNTWNSNNTPETDIFKNIAGDVTATSVIMADEWVGYGDKIDYRRVNIEAPGSYNFTLDGLTLGSPAKFTLYSIVTDKNGNETSLKALKSLAVSKTESGSSGTLLLDRGSYYVSVEVTNAATAKNTAYELAVDAVTFNSANEYEDNAWNSEDTPSISIDNGGGTGEIDITLVDSEWVGFGDKIDYRRTEIDAAGEYNFTLSGLSVGSHAKFSLYSIVTDKNGNETGLKALKSVSVTPTLTNASGSTGAFLLDSGSYYISVEATNAAQAKNTQYSVDLTGSAFVKGDNADDTFATAVQFTGAVSNEWVGFGDKIDAYKFSLTAENAGIHSFTLTSDAGDAIISLYRDNGSSSPVLIKSVTAGTNGIAGINDCQLLDGNYFITVKSADNGAGKKNTDYSIVSSGSAYKNISLDNREGDRAVGSSEAATLAAGKSEMYSFTLEDATALSLTKENTTALALYKNVNNTLTAVTLKDRTLLQAGTYYLKATNTAKNEAEVTVSLTADYYPADENGTWEGAQELNLENGVAAGYGAVSTTVNGWVGYNNGADYYKFTTGDTGEYVNFEFARNYMSSTSTYMSTTSCTLNISIGRIVNGQFSALATKSITPASVEVKYSTADEFGIALSANTEYYFKVETPDKGQGAYSSAYELNVYDYNYTDNNSFASATTLDLSSGFGNGATGSFVSKGDKINISKFTATSDGLVNIQLKNAHSSVKLSVFDENLKQIGTTVASTLTGKKDYQDATLSSISLKEGQTYYIKAEANSAFSEYYINIADANTSFTKAATLNIKNGNAEYSSSSYVSSYDNASEYFKFTGNGTYDCAFTDKNSYDWDGDEIPDATVSVSLYDSKYNYIGEFSGSMELNGTYYIKVSTTPGNFYAVDYALSITQESNSFDDAIVLDPASSPAVYSKTYVEGDNADFFKFTASGKYDMSISGLSSLTFYAQDKETIVAMADASGLHNFEFNGTYYVRADFGESYTLNFSKSNNTIADATLLEETSGRTEYITAKTDTDPVNYYKFTVSEGHYTLGIPEGSYGAVTLLAADGVTTLLSSETNGIDGGMFYDQVLNGTYYLKVEGAEDGPGGLEPYNVMLLRNNNTFENAQDITLTPGYNFSVTATDESDYLRFTANGISYINVSDNDYTVNVTLYDSERNELATSAYGDLSFAEALSGTFYLKVDSINPYDNGKYSVSISTGNNGSTENNSFETATRISQDSNYWDPLTFSGDDSGDYYIISAKGYYDLGIETSSELKVTLYDISLKQLDSVVASSVPDSEVSGIFKDVNMNGTYYLKVESAGDPIEEKSYRPYLDISDDTFERANVVTPVSGNGWGSGTLDQNDMVDFFKFTVDSSYDLSLSNYADASLTLYNQNRVEVNPETTTDDFGSLNMNLNAGTYYAKLEIGAASPTLDISYNLSLSKAQIA